jgi:hypothetical protein
MIALNLFFADALLKHIVRLFPGFISYQASFLVAIGLVFSVMALVPKQSKKLLVSFPLILVLLMPMALFDIFYQAPVFSLRNFSWFYLTTHPSLLLLGIMMSLVNFINLKKTSSRAVKNQLA